MLAAATVEWARLAQVRQGHIVHGDDTHGNEPTVAGLSILWQAPMYTGGQEITNYILHYTIIERHISATSRNILIDKPCKYVVGNVTR